MGNKNKKKGNNPGKKSRNGIVCGFNATRRMFFSRPKNVKLPEYNGPKISLDKEKDK